MWKNLAVSHFRSGRCNWKVELVVVVSSVETGIVEPVYRDEGVFESEVEGEGTRMGNYIIVLKLSYPHTY